MNRKTSLPAAFACAFLSLVILSARPARGEETTERNCFGLLWCTERSSTTFSADFLFSLYSVDRTPTREKFALRPFYFQEKDKKRGSVERSVLWPLTEYERDADASWFHFFPLYWHRVASYRDGIRYTLAIPLFYRASNDKEDAATLYALPSFASIRKKDEKKVFLFPIWSLEKRPGYRRVNAIGFPTTVRANEGPSLALYERVRSTGQSVDRFTPLFYRRATPNGSDTNVLLLYNQFRFSDRRGGMLFPLFGWQNGPEAHSEANALGFRQLSFFWTSRDGTRKNDHLFPLYSRQTSEDERWLGVLGYGPVSLYWRRNAPSDRVVRLFPFYERTAEDDERTMSLLGVSSVALYHRVRSPDQRLDQLFPFYRRDAGPDSASTEVLGISALSLYRREVEPGSRRERLFPIYGIDASQENGRHVTALGLPPMENAVTDLALYSHKSSGTVVSDRFFPLYTFEREGDERDLNVLLVYSHKRTTDRLSDALLPLHLYRRNLSTGHRELYLIGVPPLTLYASSTSPTESRRRLFPLYSVATSSVSDRGSLDVLGFGPLSLYHRSHEDGNESERFFPVFGRRRWEGGSAISALGFPPPRNGAAFALFEHREDGPRRTTRLFPLAWSSEDADKDRRHLNVLLLFDTAVSSDSRRAMLFPLWSMRRSPEVHSVAFFGFDFASLIYVGTAKETRLTWFVPFFIHAKDTDGPDSFTDVGVLYSRLRRGDETATGLFPVIYNRHDKRESTTAAIGLDPIFPVSLYRRHRTETSARTMLFPLFDRRRDEHPDRRRTSLLGVGKLSLFYRDVSTTTVSERFFPLYARSKSAGSQERNVNVALLYHHRTRPDAVSDGLFPLWSYSHATDPNRKEFGLVGAGAFSLYRHESSSDTTRDALFPLYRYRFDRTSGEKRASVLWPLASYRSEQGRVADVNVLWWLVRYQREDDGARELRVLGGHAMAVYRRSRTPQGFRMEFNPILPFYSFERSGTDGQNTEWNFLGGLIGRKKTDGVAHPRFFWIRL